MFKFQVKLKYYQKQIKKLNNLLMVFFLVLRIFLLVELMLKKMISQAQSKKMKILNFYNKLQVFIILKLIIRIHIYAFYLIFYFIEKNKYQKELLNF